MRTGPSTAAALAALLAAAVTGCGSTLYDAKGVPLAQCTPAAPLSCGGQCLPLTAEADQRCGTACLDCTGGDGATLDPVAVNVCNAGGDVAQHACDFACPAGMHKDTVDLRCACDAATQVRCVGSTACLEQSPTLCGDGCLDCTQGAVPSHATAACDAVARHCDFACAAGFKKDALGAACVCAQSNQVACGVASACVTETATSCSDACLDCTGQRDFPHTGNVTIASISCNTTTSVHQCDYSCGDPALPRKCVDPVTGAADCCAAAGCPTGENLCTRDNTCALPTDVTHCGTACADCTQGLPVGATAQCVASGGDFACAFACPAGYLKSNGQCVKVANPPAPLTPSTVALGARHTCAITTAGGLMCWGSNASGQLGVPGTGDRLTPVDVPLPAGVTPVFVAAGPTRTCVIASGTGAVTCWGDGSTTMTAVAGVSGAVALAVGASHTCAVLANPSTHLPDAVQCWGADDQGQLGDGAVTPLPTLKGPTAVALPPGTNVLQISSRANHTCVRTSGAVAFCWGSNDLGQIAQSPPAPVATPAQIAALTGAASIAAGGEHSCGGGLFTTAGTSWTGSGCWGDGRLAQLGDKLQDPLPMVTPVHTILIAGGGTLSHAVVAGRDHSCVTKIGDLTGAVLCGGANDSYQTGDPLGGTVSLKGPDIVIGAALDDLVAGDDHTCVLVAGTLSCWGKNDHGQLGNGSTASVPVGVGLGPVSPSPQ